MVTSDNKQEEQQLFNVAMLVKRNLQPPDLMVAILASVFLIIYSL